MIQTNLSNLFLDQSKDLLDGEGLPINLCQSNFSKLREVSGEEKN
jgi:hypothetical protein